MERDCSENFGNDKEILDQGEDALNVSSVQGIGPSWCIDSGCTAHMCNDRSQFSILNAVRNKSLKIADKSSTQIVGEGEAHILLEQGDVGKKLKLENAIYVPDLRNNLLSVAKMTDRGYQVHFDDEKATVTKSNGELLFIAQQYNGLYWVREEHEHFNNLITEGGRNGFNESIKMLDVWHKRMGHLSESDMKNLIRTRAVFGLRFNIKDRLSKCESCLRGKMTVDKLPKPVKMDGKPLDLIHINCLAL